MINFGVLIYLHYAVSEYILLWSKFYCWYKKVSLKRHFYNSNYIKSAVITDPIKRVRNDDFNVYYNSMKSLEKGTNRFNVVMVYPIINGVYRILFWQQTVGFSMVLQCGRALGGGCIERRRAAPRHWSPTASPPTGTARAAAPRHRNLSQVHKKIQPA